MMTMATPRGHGGPVRPQVLGRLRHLGGDDLLGGVAGERAPAGEQLVPDDAHGVQVRPVIGLPVRHGLLRRHVARRAQREPGRRDELRARRLVQRLGHAEVHQQRVPAREHDVVWLDVAVDHPLAVGVGQRVEHVAQDPDGVLQGQLALAREPVPERLALDVRHDVEDGAVGLATVVQRQDRGMLELRRHLDLAQEPLGAERGREIGAQHLDGDLPVVLQVLREIDRPHPAASQLPLEAVPVAEGFGEARGNAVHGFRVEGARIWSGAPEASPA